MGYALACKRGKAKNCPEKIQKLADEMTDKQLSDFASTKEKGLPTKVKENKLVLKFNEFINEDKNYSDNELIELMKEQFDYYKKFGDRHNKNMSDEKIMEIYYDQALEKVLEFLELDGKKADLMAERIAKLF